MIVTLNPRILHFSKLHPLSRSSSYIYRTRNVSLTTNCKLQKPENGNQRSSGNLTKTISLSDSAPPVVEETDVEVSGDRVVKGGGNGGGGGGDGRGLGFLKKLPRKVLSVLSNLPLAITEMATIAALMALGTVIEQGETPDFYFQKYPEDNPVFGFFTWRWIFTLGFDHMYSAPIFLGMLVLLAASLMACTYTTQIPLVKVARRWSFLKSDEAIKKQEFADTLPRASIQDLGMILMGDGFEVFMKGPSLYAFKGLAGRFAPIGVHISMLLIMVGGTLSATGSFRGSVTVPQGLNFVMGDVLAPIGFFSVPADAFNTEVHVNRFTMDYYDSGEISQYHSDLSLRDLNGKEVLGKTISVNDPLRYGGVTIYQTDWSFSALQVTKDGEGPFNLAMAPIKINGDKKLYGTFLPVGDTNAPNVKGISMLARDLQSIVVYDLEGKFAGIRRPNSKLPIEVNGMKIVIEDAIGSTGLELKTDPGVPVVYAGFGALMLTTCISYLSHSQIWALQNGTTLVVGGRTNRAKNEFPDDMNRLLDQVPELINKNPSVVSEQS
ncbi:PREDICTED: cytochrome c biogenesis protein CCS1, chloroplastic [Camelina sativa]|uniref:Cytochrome c biogenesis protein CCS1, chloroplastic n=1 Tax=Camelina sativa TaxID=90675 RepID=A0ABM0X1V4_CAMSA|nr:PREDICTED: cytochrome c biogenesis protein CCS1, chloroplastic [Camelina sativa]XP_010479371.1 PREDICTED: cytochrome c biogenesis protein CCS1, chloroplastic [Camelina sativa]